MKHSQMTGKPSAAKTSQRKQVDNLTTKPRSPRRFWFGPGVVITTIASVIIWRQLTPLNDGPPVIERTRLEATSSPTLSTPDPTWLLAQRDGLGLSAAQVQKLSALESRWKRDTHDLQAALDRAVADFQRGMEAGRTQRANVEHLQARAAPVSALTRQLLDAHRAWWGQAATVLTTAQRQRAEQAWTRHFVKRKQ